MKTSEKRSNQSKGVMVRSIQRQEEIYEVEGTLSSQSEEDKLLHSVLDGENTTEGRIIKNALNQGISSFNPDFLFEQLVTNYNIAKNIYGEKILQEVVGDEKDIRFPENRKKIRKNIEDLFFQMKKQGLLGKELDITQKGIRLASLILYTEELSQLEAKGFRGEHMHKRKSHYGEPTDIKRFHKGDRYKDIAIRESLSLAMRRRHKNLEKEDLLARKRQDRGRVNIIYALDASGSMKGEKIEMCKKAGIALAHHAIEQKDKVGLLIFGTKVEEALHPTHDFALLLEKIAGITPKKETNLSQTILKTIELFTGLEGTNHLILITDALPTVGESPEKDTIEATSKAHTAGITVSVIGIHLDKKGEELAREIAAVGNGTFRIATSPKQLDVLVLEDYYAL